MNRKQSTISIGTRVVAAATCLAFFASCATAPQTARGPEYAQTASIMREARSALLSAVRGLWTTSGLGANWVEKGAGDAAYSELDGLTHLAMAFVLEHPAVTLGVSPRGTLALYRACEAFAAMQGRDYVQPDDVKRLAPGVLAHRLLTTTRVRLRGSAAEAIISEIMASVPVPVETISLPQKR